MKKPEITTMTDGVVTLRRVDLTDVDALAEGVRASIDRLHPWMPWAKMDHSRDDAAWFVATTWLHWHGGKSYEFLVTDAEDGRMLGMCGLNSVSSDGRANLGYWVREGETGRGVCTAAARLVARFGFEQLGLSRIRLFHAAGNLGSQRVAEKVGFVLEGVQRKRLEIHGTFHDTKLYSLVSPDEITG